MTHIHRFVECRTRYTGEVGESTFVHYVVCRDCGAQSDELPFDGQSVREESA